MHIFCSINSHYLLKKLCRQSLFRPVLELHTFYIKYSTVIAQYEKITSILQDVSLVKKNIFLTSYQLLYDFMFPKMLAYKFFWERRNEVILSIELKLTYDSSYVNF